MTESDVNMAFDLIKDALQQSATDPTTGFIDMDIIVTGHTSASRKRVDKIIQILKDLFLVNASDYMKKVGFERCMDDVSQKWRLLNDEEPLPRSEDVNEALHRLEKDGVLNLFGDRKNKPMFKYIATG